MAVCINGYEGMSHGLVTWHKEWPLFFLSTINTPLPLTLKTPQEEALHTLSQDVVLVVVLV